MASENLRRAYVLHSRPYRETSAIIELLTEDGRLSLVARGARAAKAKNRAALQLFTPLLVSWAGRGELLTLSQVENLAAPAIVFDRPPLEGFYLNELIIRLLHKHDPHPEVFALYEQTLARLGQEAVEPVLREFELELLDALGYGFALDCDDAGQPLEFARWYRFIPERGLVLSDFLGEEHPRLYRGELLLAFGHRDFSRADVRRCAKRLMREALAVLLGDKPLASRELFRRSG